MGKPVPVVLCAALVAALGVNAGAQEAPEESKPEPIKPGTFLTAEDLECLDAALGYVNLTREQLNYEKKHADSRLRLKVCDRALDEPLSVPRFAEESALVFAAKSPPVARAAFVTRTLDEPTDRWNVAELQADNHREAARNKEYEDLWRNGRPTKNEGEELSRRHRNEQVRDFFGGAVVRRHEKEGIELDDQTLAAIDIFDLLGVLGTLDRTPLRISSDQRSSLAGAICGILAGGDLPLPGSSANNAPIFDAGARVDLAAILIAGSRLSLLLEGKAEHWRKEVRRREGGYEGKQSTVPGITGGIIRCWQGPWGKFVIGGTGPNTYEGDDFIGIIDLDGDDIYRGRVASGIGLPGKSPIGFVLDLGGNDRYEGEDFTQGFGFLGVGILHDLGGGNDTYKSRFCSQACGLCGCGELYDDGGDDLYIGDSGVQGAGVFGYGQLIDARGNDVYRACRYAQAFAQVKGVGVLTDGAGNDLYYASGKYLHQPLWNDRYQSLSQGFAIGNRNEGTGGGVALLLDEGDGNDVYQADIYGQGSSYWYSLGMLVDRGGNDTYTLGQYGQGAGIHLSAGILVDLAGNDTYTNPFGVGTGGAHDWAVGWLIDRAGNDLYQGNGQGQGLNYAIGILLDCAGNDSHISNNELSVGKGHNNDISLLIDLGGTDVYGPKDVKDGQFTRRGEHALVFDAPEGWFPGVDASTLPTKQDPPPQRAIVQNILISWKGADPRVTLKDPERTREGADALMRKVLRQSRTRGSDWKKLQADHNEDSAPHSSYEVTPTAGLVRPFLDLSLKLGVGQIDVCESQYGWHIIKRMQ